MTRRKTIRPVRWIGLVLGGVSLAAVLTAGAQTQPASGTPADAAFYVGGAGKTRLSSAFALSDGTLLVGGASDSLDWLPANVPTAALGGPVPEGGDTGLTPFLLRLSPDAKRIVCVLTLPRGCAEDVAAIKTTSSPGRPTGALLIAGRTRKDEAKGRKSDGYFIARLDGNFIDAPPKRLLWVYTVRAGDDIRNHMPWDVGADGRVIYAMGYPHSYDWVAIEALDANGKPAAVPKWRTHWAKGIWTATWESTGGPQYFSGGKSPFVAETRDRTAGFTVDAGTIAQLMLSYLAAGFKGFGFWAWNHRTAGWEAGEYALLDRNSQPTDRAVRAGQIGKAACRWSRELWAAHKEPLVGVLADWDNEAIWACMAVGGRDHFKTTPVRARIGASRAFIDANVPWEYVTLADLRGGLGPRYRVLYLPAMLALRDDLREVLLAYVQEGGRLVMDMPGAYYDAHGRMLPTAPGSWFETLFGCVLHDFGYARDNQRPGRCGDVAFEGFVADLEPTRATVTLRHDNGQPAVTEARVGRGTAVLLNLPASLSCWKPGAPAMQRLLVRHALGRHKSPYACDGALVYRLAAPGADHYFLINDGPATTVRLRVQGLARPRFEDAVDGETLAPGRPIALEAHGGRWLRLPRP